MQYRVTYTEHVIITATFEGPKDLDEFDFFGYLNDDPNAQYSRIDVTERDVVDVQALPNT